MLKLVLASASPRRIELLKLIGLDFDIMPANINENSDNFFEAGKYAIEMSRRKAVSVAEEIRTKVSGDTMVLGADTIVVTDDLILGKPADSTDAEHMLKLLENRWHEVITGITLVKTSNLEIISDKEVTRVKFSAFPKGFLDRYITSGEPFDKAGSYGIQGLGSLIVERIEGCYFNVMGLPLLKLSRMLERQGIEVLSWL